MLIALCLIFFISTLVHFFLLAYKFSPIAWEYTGFNNNKLIYKNLSVLKRTLIPYFIISCFPYILFRSYVRIDLLYFDLDVFIMLFLIISTLLLIIFRKKIFNSLKSKLEFKSKTAEYLPEIKSGPRGIAYEYYAIKALLIQIYYPKERINDRHDKEFYHEFCKKETDRRKKKWPHELKKHELNPGSFKTQYRKFQNWNINKLLGRKKIISYLINNNEFEKYPKVLEMINKPI